MFLPTCYGYPASWTPWDILHEHCVLARWEVWGMIDSAIRHKGIGDVRACLLLEQSPFFIYFFTRPRRVFVHSVANSDAFLLHCTLAIFLTFLL